MYHLLMNLPVIGTLGFVAMLAGPIANLSLLRLGSMGTGTARRHRRGWSSKNA